MDRFPYLRKKHSFDEVQNDASNTETLQRSQRSEDEIQPDVYGVFNSGALVRSPRSVNETDVSNVEALARLTSGASLVIALLDDKTNLDQYIIDLLRIGGLKLEDIINMNQPAIVKALNLAQDPLTDGEVKAVEDWLIKLDKTRKDSAFMLTFSKLFENNEYENKLEKVLEIGQMADGLKNIQTALDGIRSYFSKFNSASPIDNAFATSLLGQLNSMGIDLGVMEGAAKTIKTVLAPLVLAKEITTPGKFHGILDKEISIRNDLGDRQPFDENSIYDAVKKTIETIYTSRDESKSAEASLETIRKLIQTRHPSFRHLFQFLPGLPSGYVDLGKLHTDSGNKWITERFGQNSKQVTDGLKTGFSSFKEMKNELEHVETDSWKGLNDVSAGKVVDSQLKVAKLTGDSTTTKNNLDTIKTCESKRTIPVPPSYTSAKSVLDDVDKLNKSLERLSTLEYASSLVNMTDLKTLLTVDSKQTDQIKAATELREKVKNSEAYKTVNTNLPKLQSDLTALATAITEVPQLAQKIKDNFGKIKKYHDDIVGQTAYLNFFTCINNGGDITSLVSSSLFAAQEARMDPNVFKSGKQALVKILESKAGVKNAKEKAEAIKKLNVPVVLALKPAFGKDHLTVSKSFGFGVQGLTAIWNVHNAQKSLQSINFDDIQKDAKTAKLSKEQQTAIQEFVTLPTVFKSIDAFLDKPASKAARKKRNVNFNNAKKLFEDAKNVKGVKINMEHLRGAMKALNVNNKYTPILPMLDLLEQLDLDFANFKFQNAGNQLTPIDGFFASYGKGIAAIPPAQTIGNPVQPGVQPSQLPLLLITTTIGTATKSIPYFEIIGGSVFGGFVIGTISYGIWRVFFRKKEVVDDESESEKMPELPKEDCLALSMTCYKAIVANIKAKTPPTKWAQNFYKSLVLIGNMTIGEDEKKHEDERRHIGWYCYEKTMATITGFPDNFINANVFEIGPVKWILTQGPLDGTEEVKEKEIRKVDTREKFWAMIDQNGVKIVAQLCQFEELEVEEVEDPKTKETKKIETKTKKCGPYYSTKKGESAKLGKYTITTKDILENLDQFSDKSDFKLYKLEYTHSEKKETKEVDVLLYSAWPDHSAPARPEPALEIIKFVDSYKSNVVVHCSAGVGRTGSLAAIKFGINLCQREIIREPSQVIAPVRNIRYGSVQSADQLIYVVLCITKGVIDKRGFYYWEPYYALEYFYQNVTANKYGNPWNYEEDLQLMKKHYEAKEIECKAREEADEKKKKELEEERKKKEAMEPKKKQSFFGRFFGKGASASSADGSGDPKKKKKKRAAGKKGKGKKASGEKGKKASVEKSKTTSASVASNPTSVETSGEQKNKKKGSVEKSSSEKGKGKKASAEQKGAKKSSASSVSNPTSGETSGDQKKKASDEKGKGKKENPKKGAKKTK